MAHDRAYTRLTKLEVDTLIINTSATYPGGAQASAGDLTITAGNLIFTAASAKVIPGATSLLIRNTGDTASNVSITDAGVVTITGATVGNAQLIITSTNAAALAVGRLGATTPAFQIDASAATSITGIKITSAAAGNGVAIAATGETNVAVTISAAGSGTLTLTSTTGNVVIGTALAFATDAGGAKSIIAGTANGLKIGTAANQKLGFFNAAPVVQQTKAGHNNWTAVGDVVDALVSLGLFDTA